MAPADDSLASIKDYIKKLESRVDELESKLSKAGGNVTPRGAANSSVRMILIGPPGAGAFQLQTSSDEA